MLCWYKKGPACRWYFAHSGDVSRSSWHIKVRSGSAQSVPGLVSCSQSLAVHVLSHGWKIAEFWSGTFFAFLTSEAVAFLRGQKLSLAFHYWEDAGRTRFAIPRETRMLNVLPFDFVFHFCTVCRLRSDLKALDSGIKMVQALIWQQQRRCKQRDTNRSLNFLSPLPATTFLDARF